MPCSSFYFLVLLLREQMGQGLFWPLSMTKGLLDVAASSMVTNSLTLDYFSWAQGLIVVVFFTLGPLLVGRH